MYPEGVTMLSITISEEDISNSSTFNITEQLSSPLTIKADPDANYTVHVQAFDGEDLVASEVIVLTKRNEHEEGEFQCQQIIR